MFKKSVMNSSKQYSLTYRILRKLGFNYSETEYGQVSFWNVVKRFFGNMRRKRLSNMMDWAILEPFAPRNLRPKILRKIGCNVGRNVFIGDFVRIDLQHASMITIGDYTHITSGCRLLCHQRDLTNYRVGDNAADLGYKKGNITIGRGCMIGMETMIMPGVTIGDGAIIGAHSLVTKDIPAWTIATGVPARVVKQVPNKESDEHPNL